MRGQLAIWIFVAIVSGTPFMYAQVVNEVLSSRLNNIENDLFGCGTPASGQRPCNLYVRIYGDVDPTLINDPAIGPGSNGFPIFRRAAQAYVAPSAITGNYPGVNERACEAWYIVWTGAIAADSADFAGYYAAQSTIINRGETGNTATADCDGESVSAVGCFGALDSTSAVRSSSNTLRGTLAPIGGLEPVPVPKVTGRDLLRQSVTLSWAGAGNSRTVNRNTGIPCPSESMFGDSRGDVELAAPNPIWGVRLFVHTVPLLGDYRNLASLEGSATAPETGHLAVLSDDSSGLRCTVGADSTVCPGLHEVRCDAVSGGNCTPGGREFLPVSQAVEIFIQGINATLLGDGPIDLDKAPVFNTKVVFRGAVAGSHARPGNDAVNPALLSVFSANSFKVRFDCNDRDGDGFCEADCDDGDASVFPGAPKLCDGFNNDCSDPSWPALRNTEETDDDGDGFSECQGDCDDGDKRVFSGALQLCDGVNNNCDDPLWPEVADSERNQDGDGFLACNGDCDDANPSVYPGALQLCDGINNDCDDAMWPDPPGIESDADRDSFEICAGDCNDGDERVFPGAAEVCFNGIDDNCDGASDSLDIQCTMPQPEAAVESFVVVLKGPGVLATWTTRWEKNVAAFSLMRKRTDQRPALVHGLALSQSDLGGSYQLFDPKPQPPGTVAYFVRAHNRAGGFVEYGPALVVVPATSTGEPEAVFAKPIVFDREN